MYTLGIIFPVLNEKLRLEDGIVKTVEYIENNLNCDYQITIVDNGSTDETPLIGKKLSEKYAKVEYIRTNEKGVGIAFREGIKKNKCDIVGYMDVDLSTDIKHLSDVVRIFEENQNVQIVNASRLNKKSLTTGRKWYRNITSYGLTFILKCVLKLKATDSICGFKFFKKEVAEKLIEQASDDKGWFYIIEVLLRAERQKMNIVELPVVWNDDYNTTVKVFKLIKYYLIQIKRLRKVFKQEKIL